MDLPFVLFQVGNAVGGVMIMPTYTENDTPCPWHINFRKSDVYFYWKKHFNHWNPKGNGWKLENKIDVR